MFPPCFRYTDSPIVGVPTIYIDHKVWTIQIPCYQESSSPLASFHSIAKSNAGCCGETVIRHHLQMLIMTRVTGFVHTHNRCMILMDIINCFLIGLAPDLCRETHARYYKCGQEPMVRDLTSSREECSTIILLNMYNVKLPFKLVSFCPQIRAAPSSYQRRALVQWSTGQHRNLELVKLQRIRECGLFSHTPQGEGTIMKGGGSWKV